MAIQRRYSLWINGELVPVDLRPHFYVVESVRGNGKFNLLGEPLGGRGRPKARFWWGNEVKASVYNYWANLVGDNYLSAWLDNVTLVDGDYAGTAALPYHASYPGGILGKVQLGQGAYPDLRNGELYFIGGAEFYIYELGKQRSA